MKKTNKQLKWIAETEREFLAAYDEHSDALFRHCLIRVRDREATKDVVQEAFAKTWNYMAEGKKIEYLRAFLYRVANNLIIDTSRKKKSSSLDAMMDEDGFEIHDESVKDPSERMEIREAFALLESLDDVYRSAITMRFFDEMSPREIARALNVSENVVSVRIHRGIERLQALKRSATQAAA